MDAQRICSVPGCGKTLIARGFCWMHYKRLIRGTDPCVSRGLKAEAKVSKPRRTTTAATMLQLLSVETDECIIWPHGRNTYGYGVGWWEGRGVIASRQICELAYGPPPRPNWHHAAHSCGKGHEGCVNKRHLRWATPKENSEEMVVHRSAGISRPRTRRNIDTDSSFRYVLVPF